MVVLYLLGCFSSQKKKKRVTHSTLLPLSPLLKSKERKGSIIAVRYRIDFDKSALNFALNAMGPSWTEVDDSTSHHDEYWHFWWASVGTIRQLFSDTPFRLADFQLVNHFPNHYELTRKDLMYRNIRLHSKAASGSSACSPTGLAIWECVPVTFSLPNDYSLFCEEFKRVSTSTASNGPALWIVKPANRSQGRGIFLISKLNQVMRWMKDRASEAEENPRALTDPFIVSRYIDKPLLIGGKKFDLRLYVLVTCYRPLRAYFHRQGVCEVLFGQVHARDRHGGQRRISCGTFDQRCGAEA